MYNTDTGFQLVAQLFTMTGQHLCENSVGPGWLESREGAGEKSVERRVGLSLS